MKIRLADEVMLYYWSNLCGVTAALEDKYQWEDWFIAVDYMKDFD